MDTSKLEIEGLVNVERIYSDVFTADAGSAAITFVTLDAAVACCSLMHGRTFDRRLLHAGVIDPESCRDMLSRYTGDVMNSSVGDIVAPVTTTPCLATSQVEDIETEATGIDNFLNSLL
jgi:hypothetical protein